MISCSPLSHNSAIFTSRKSDIFPGYLGSHNDFCIGFCTGIWSYPAGNHVKTRRCKKFYFLHSYLDFISPGEGSFYLFEALGKNSHVTKGAVGQASRDLAPDCATAATPLSRPLPASRRSTDRGR